MQKLILLIMLFMITTIIYSQNPCLGTPTVLYGGKTYNTVQIGTQCWLKENLEVGTMIQVSQNASNNGTIEKYCYNNDPTNCTTYGGLYQWNEAMAYTTGTKGICPTGWHIPTQAEFQALMTAVSNNTNALKAMGVGFGDGVGTNTSGFSALASGYYWPGNSFFGLSANTIFWSSTEQGSTNAYHTVLYYGSNDFRTLNPSKDFSYSIRCIKDESGTAVEGDNEKGLPTEYSLSQNYPNPFNPNTTINFSIPKASPVTIKVYDELGKEVATIVNEYKPVGNYRLEFNASKLVSGIYFYRLQVGNYSETKKLILVK